MSKYIISNGQIKVISDASISIVDALPVNTYKVNVNKMTGELFLTVTDSFVIDTVVYGDNPKYADRIINTFEKRKNNTGVLLCGEKGSGKTLLCKQLSVDMRAKKYSTIIVDSILDPFALSNFIKDVSEPCLIIFDEFDKLYSFSRDEDGCQAQDALLSLLDGLYITKKLFVFTCNDVYRINDMFKNRPGRIFYNIPFNGINDEIITQYCEKNLTVDAEIISAYTKQIINISKLFYNFTFDMVKSLVEEVNRYKEAPFDAINIMNIIPDNYDKCYELKVLDKITNVEYNTDYGNSGCSPKAHVNVFNKRIMGICIRAYSNKHVDIFTGIPTNETDKGDIPRKSLANYNTIAEPISAQPKVSHEDDEISFDVYRSDIVSNMNGIITFISGERFKVVLTESTEYFSRKSLKELMNNDAF